MHLQFDIQLQCIQISTRINSSMYIRTSLVCSTLRVSSIRIYILIQSNIQHGVRIEAVATSLQQGESTDRIQQFPAYLQAS